MSAPLGLSDALLDGFVGNFYRVTDGVRDLLASLHEDNELLALPQIVVVGEESSGKSSVLESLAMLELFPRDEHICTRMPIHLKLRRQTNPTIGRTSTVKMRLVYSDDRATNELDVPIDEAKSRMRGWMNEIVKLDAGAVRGIVEHVIEIHVTSANVPNLDLVDLPGIVAGHIADEPTDMMEQTRALVERYMRMPHTLVLAVARAGERVRNSQAFQLVQQVGLTDRTIGVLTMVDRAADPSDPRGPYTAVKARLDGTSGDIVALEPYGYVAVMSRDTREPRALSLEDFKAHETGFLLDHLEEYVDRRLASSTALAEKVAAMLTEHVRHSWVPVIVEQLHVEATRIENELASMGKGAATIAEELLDSEQSRQTTLKLLLGPSLDRVMLGVDAAVRDLMYVLCVKMDARLRELQDASLLSAPPSSSLVAKMMRRNAIVDLLRELFEAIVMSAFFRLVMLVRKEIQQQKVKEGDSYHAVRFDKLYLLSVATMWPKVHDLLSKSDRLVDAMVTSMETSNAVKTAVVLPKTMTTKDGASKYGDVVYWVNHDLEYVHGERDLPQPLEDVTSERPFTVVPVSPRPTPISSPMVTRDELHQLVVAVSQHIVAPLVCHLMNIQAMGNAVVSYLRKNPVTEEQNRLHWFHETSGSKRRNLNDTLTRLNDAETGLTSLV